MRKMPWESDWKFPIGTLLRHKTRRYNTSAEVIGHKDNRYELQWYDPQGLPSKVNTWSRMGAHDKLEIAARPVHFEEDLFTI